MIPGFHRSSLFNLFSPLQKPQWIRMFVALRDFEIEEQKKGSTNVDPFANLILV